MPDVINMYYNDKSSIREGDNKLLSNAEKFKYAVFRLLKVCGTRSTQ